MHIFTLQKVVKQKCKLEILYLLASSPMYIFTLQKVVKQRESENGRQSKFSLSNCIWDIQYTILYYMSPPGWEVESHKTSLFLEHPHRE